MIPVYADLRPLGLCRGDDNQCKYRDEFFSESVSTCASACEAVPECEIWSIGVKVGQLKASCLLRRGSDYTREPREGWVSGSSTCAPHKDPEKYSDDEDRELVQIAESFWTERAKTHPDSARLMAKHGHLTLRQLRSLEDSSDKRTLMRLFVQSHFRFKDIEV
jgi:hypothetical protein